MLDKRSDTIQELLKAIKQLQAQIAELEGELEKHRWIPVSERLPKETEEDLRPKHLILTGDGIDVQEWRHFGFGWSFDDNGGIPTHWMEQIALPETKAKEGKS